MSSGEPLIASSIQLYEVYKVIRRDISEERAIEGISAMRVATIVPLDDALAIEAADITLDLGLAMADAIICATARRFRASIVTMDVDFEPLPEAVVIRPNP